MFVVGDDLLRHMDLRTQRRDLQHLDDYVAADAKPHCAEFGGHVLSHRSRLVDARSRAAEEIEIVTDYRTGGIGGEYWKILGQRTQHCGAEAGSLNARRRI